MFGVVFRIYCNIWAYDDYFDIEADDPPATTTTIQLTTSTTSSVVVTTTTTVEPTTTTTTAICASEAIYGEDSEEIEILRYVRDNILSQTPEGREIIRLYYEWSPAIIKAMEADPQLKEDIKETIDMLIGF